MGLSARRWPGRNLHPVHVLVMDLGKAASLGSRFTSLLTQLNEEGRLGRLVIDEAHLLVMWATFRPLFRLVHRVLRGLPCPLILLSATVPPTWVPFVRK